MQWRRIVFVSLTLASPPGMSFAQQTEGFFATLKNLSGVYGQQKARGDIKPAAQQFQEAHDVGTKSEAAMQMVGNTATLIPKGKGNLGLTLTGLLAKVRLTAPIAANQSMAVSHIDKMNLAASNDPDKGAKLEALSASEMGRNIKAARQAAPVIAALQPNEANIRNAIPVVQESIQGFVNTTLKRVEARKSSSLDTEPVATCGEMDWFNNECEHEDTQKEEAPTRETSGVGWAIDGDDQCMPAPIEFSQFINEFIIDDNTINLCRILTKAEVNKNNIIFSTVCEKVPNEPSYGSTRVNFQFKMVSPDHIVRTEWNQTGEGSTYDYRQCQLSSEETAEMDCSPEGQAAYKAEHHVSSVGYLCPNPL
ncbi:hypothetical protein B5K11_20010 [Rhizobium leguminosarum bv. trifolii]|uniref:hypothetical protein n=1 Tax=Rhizobium leguminosarum TaxID=384 RepID=UPI000E2FA786|nr:hypothetical protein [Rhizobium leguminosarum]RFB90341.1 hypothetical protein B5K11_20010 [Rhizobium leguminosarum bv. trifolii]